MTEHYYSPNPTSEFKTKELKVTALGNELKITTASGIFSKERVDKGSLLLIEKALIKDGDSVLDLGCGYGIIGIAVAKAHRLKRVVFTDVNERAVSLTRINCQSNGIHAEINHGNAYQGIDGRFDAILLNPPQTAGKDICIAMIRESMEHLADDGKLQVVARHSKGGKSLSEEMKKVFGNLSVLGKSGGYRVYGSAKTKDI